MTSTHDVLASQKQWLGHPVGLFVCFFTEMWERFSFYGISGILVLYLSNEIIKTKTIQSLQSVSEPSKNAIWISVGIQWVILLFIWLTNY